MNENNKEEVRTHPILEALFKAVGLTEEEKKELLEKWTIKEEEKEEK